MKKSWLTLIAVPLAIGLVLAGCSGTSAVGEAELHDAEEHGHHAAEEEGDDAIDYAVIEGTSKVILTATEWAFTPETVTVKLGEPVTVVLVNEGIVEHDVELAEFGLHLHAAPGETLAGSFIADRERTFEFACEIPGHRGAGMVGTLVVTH